MKVSVVTPVYNDNRVGRALDSTFRQCHGHELETIVIDAGSTDGTLDVLERYRSRIDVLISEPDRGIYDGMNKGIGRAGGDVIGILNADDRYDGQHVLRDAVAALQQNDADVCYGNLVYVNDQDQPVRYWRAGPSTRKKWRLGWMPPHPTFFVRRSVYERFGAFNLDFPLAADYDLMLRLLFKHGLKFAYLDRVLVQMATGGEAQKSWLNIVKANLEVNRVWRHHKLAGGKMAAPLKLARRPFQYMQRPPFEGGDLAAKDAGDGDARRSLPEGPERPERPEAERVAGS